MKPDLDAADARLVQIVDSAMAEAYRRAGEHLACRPGCDECCLGPFPINYLDARRLRIGLAALRRSDADRADRVIERARETALLLAPELPGDPVRGFLDDDEEEVASFADRFAEVPCPALDPETGFCEVYEHRPIPCRTYGPPVRFGGNSAPPCRLCFREASGDEVEAARVEVDPGTCDELAEVDDGLEQTLIAYALALVDNRTMSIAASLLPELEREAAATRRVLDRIPEDKLGWKPHEKSFSLGALAWHLALGPSQIVEALRPDVFELDEFTHPPVPDDKGEILATFDESVIAAKRYLTTLDDADANAEWKAIVKGKEVVAAPRIEFIRSTMLNHHYHHRGQLTVYLRLLDVPLPSIYGPSADEGMTPPE